MSKKKAKEPELETAPEPEAVPEAESPNAPLDRPEEAVAEIGIERDNGVLIIPAPVGWNFDRTIRFQGQNHEHVSEDAHGRWVYRQM